MSKILDMRKNSPAYASWSGSAAARTLYDLPKPTISYAKLASIIVDSTDLSELEKLLANPMIQEVVKKPPMGPTLLTTAIASDKPKFMALLLKLVEFTEESES